MKHGAEGTILKQYQGRARCLRCDIEVAVEQMKC